MSRKRRRPTREQRDLKREYEQRDDPTSNHWGSCLPTYPDNNADDCWQKRKHGKTGEYLYPRCPRCGVNLDPNPATEDWWTYRIGTKHQRIVHGFYRALVSQHLQFCPRNRPRTRRAAT